jgi:hypothetical protein
MSSQRDGVEGEQDREPRTTQKNFAREYGLIETSVGHGMAQVLQIVALLWLTKTRMSLLIYEFNKQESRLPPVEATTCDLSFYNA